MITFTSLLSIWKSEAAGRWHFVTVPDEPSAEIKAHAFGSPRGFGSVRVEATVNGASWRTSVFPMKRGGYLLPVKAAIRKKADLATGDEVTVALELL